MDPVVIVVVGTLTLGLMAVIAYGIAAVIDHYAAREVAHERRTDPAAPSTSGAVRALPDLCHIEGCGQPSRHVIHGWRLCDDCRDELEATRAQTDGVTRGGVA